MNPRFMTAIVLVVGILLFARGTGEKRWSTKRLTIERKRRGIRIHKVHTLTGYYESGTLRKETPYDSGYVHGNVKV